MFFQTVGILLGCKLEAVGILIHRHIRDKISNVKYQRQIWFPFASVFILKPSFPRRKFFVEYDQQNRQKKATWTQRVWFWRKSNFR